MIRRDVKMHGSWCGTGLAVSRDSGAGGGRRLLGSSMAVPGQSGLARRSGAAAGCDDTATPAGQRPVVHSAHRSETCSPRPTGIPTAIPRCRTSSRTAGSRPSTPAASATFRTDKAVLKTLRWRDSLPPTSRRRSPTSAAAPVAAHGTGHICRRISCAHRQRTPRMRKSRRPRSISPGCASRVGSK